MAKFYNSLLILWFFSCFAIADPYEKASLDPENVKIKIYDRSNRIELSIPGVGYIFNQSFLETILIQSRITYFLGEYWGAYVGGAYAFNMDKPERYCLEHFYNDPEQILSSPCASPESNGSDDLAPNGIPLRGANYGPAYLPIRELNILLHTGINWNPVYGKQLTFLSFTNYYDFFINAGIGLATSNYYPESLFLKNGTLSRGPVAADVPAGECPKSPGVCPTDPSVDQLIGANGRPDALAESSFLFHLSFGQKFHFLKKYHLSAEFSDYSLQGGNGVEHYVVFSMGGGLRI